MNLTFDDFSEQGIPVLSLRDQLLRGTFPHAVLITGENGFGKRSLARLIGSFLLCESSGSRPCGSCRSCQLNAKDAHPNVIRIKAGEPLSPDVKKGRTTIPVDDIREMVRLCGMFTLDQRSRIIWIQDADQMTQQAQNALLKTLEEPPAGTFFLLLTEHADQLISTVRSRCRIVKLHPWSDEKIFFVLKSMAIPEDRIRDTVRLAGGSIGNALKLAGDDDAWVRKQSILDDFMETGSRTDILRISGKWKDQKDRSDELFRTLEYQIHDMLRAGPVSASGPVPGIPSSWQSFCSHAGKESYACLLEMIRNARMQTEANVNFQAVVEQLLFALIGEKEKWRM